MTTTEILNKSVWVTYQQPQLWLFGILLSSGFSAHLWYMASIFSQQQSMRQWLFALLPAGSIARVIVVTMVLSLLFLLLNYLKLLFFVQLHAVLHRTPASDCRLCYQLAQEDYIPITRRVYVNTLLVSALTVVLTMLLVIIMKIIIGTNASWSLELVTIVTLGIIGIAVVSIWNLFSMLGVLYARLSLPRSMLIALDMVFLKSKALCELVLALSFLFVASVWLGSVFLYAVPNSIGQVYAPLVVAPALFHLFVGMSAVFSVVLFVGWMILQNIFFNTALTLFYITNSTTLRHAEPLSQPTPQV